MSDNVPAIVPPEPSREIGHADTDSWIEVASDVIKLATLIAPTEFVPRALRDSAPATAAAILYGREVGLAPMSALTMTHVIEGKPAMSAEAMRGLIYAAGHELHYDESTGARCVVRARRYGTERWTVLEWTIDQARAAGLLHKDNWKKYPRAMLVARATADIARMVFPDVIHGFRALEEFDDIQEDAEVEAPPATTRVSRTARKAIAAKKTTPTPREERPALASGPPLPGEEGYDAPGPVGGSEEQGAASPAPDTDDEAVSGQVAGGAVPTPDESLGGEGEGEAPEPPGGLRDRGPRLLNRAQQRGIEASLTALGVDNDRDERHLIASTILGRPIDSMSRVTFDEASTLMDTFGRVKDPAQLDVLLDEFDAHKADQ